MTWNVNNTINDNVTDVSDFMAGIFEQIQQGKFSEINRYMNELSMSDVHAIYLVSILRCTFMWRKHIDAWKPFLDNVRVELARRDENVESILEGLDRE